ncbi:hypothetical protein [Streptococcus sp. NLN76]|uniref:hypothetical protein n=1 Tax=Streptococcus sp. NLN76 TaxID=2822800 RepID=UPI0018AA015F|nr:hypothetical protein [Streptococcus sp. NLN76]MBF8971127.1 hypothetical protein [Streptococcus sp. NLN76]
MNQKDWMEYFEAVNGRPPTPQEYTAALTAREFIITQDALTSTSPQPTTSSLDEPFNASTSANIESPQVNIESSIHPLDKLNSETTQSLNSFKAQGSSYLSWFIDNLKKPQYQSADSHLQFGLITLSLASLFIGGGYSNFYLRFFSSLVNPSINGNSLSSLVGEIIGTVQGSISAGFGLRGVLIFSLIYFSGYFLLALLPHLFQKQAQNSNVSLLERLGKSLSFTPLLATLNLFGLFISFLIPSSLPLDFNNLISALAGLGTTGGSPFTGIAGISFLAAENPQMGSISIYFGLICLVTIIGFGVLLVNYTGNFHKNLTRFNPFYNALISLAVFALILFVLDKTLTSAYQAGFEPIKNSLNELGSSAVSAVTDAISENSEELFDGLGSLFE